MRTDHCVGPDAHVEFTVGNYGTTTSSEVEYFFVTDPVPATLKTLGRYEWPVDKKLAMMAESRHLMRKPRPLSYFAEKRSELQAKLGISSEQPARKSSSTE